MNYCRPYDLILLGIIVICNCVYFIVFSYQNRYELYHEHDPFLEPPTPSNPWTSDDIALWALDAIQYSRTFSHSFTYFITFIDIKSLSHVN